MNKLISPLILKPHLFAHLDAPFAQHGAPRTRGAQHLVKLATTELDVGDVHVMPQQSIGARLCP